MDKRNLADNTPHHSSWSVTGGIWCPTINKSFFSRAKIFLGEYRESPRLPKGWLAIAKLTPLSLFISLLLMPNEAFDNVKIEK